MGFTAKIVNLGIFHIPTNYTLYFSGKESGKMGISFEKKWEMKHAINYHLVFGDSYIGYARL